VPRPKRPAAERDSGLVAGPQVAGLIGAERHERTGERTACRNGSRLRTWDTRVGTIELGFPKGRPATYFPSLLEPRRRAEHALLPMVQEAYVHGVSTRKVTT
jgi:putative transposase